MNTELHPRTRWRQCSIALLELGGAGAAGGATASVLFRPGGASVPFMVRSWRFGAVDGADGVGDFRYSASKAGWLQTLEIWLNRVIFAVCAPPKFHRSSPHW